MCLTVFRPLATLEHKIKACARNAESYVNLGE